MIPYAELCAALSRSNPTAAASSGPPVAPSPTATEATPAGAATVHEVSLDEMHGAEVLEEHAAPAEPAAWGEEGPPPSDDGRVHVEPTGEGRADDSTGEIDLHQIID